MNRTGPPATVDDVIPPTDPKTVYRTGGLGVGLCAAAAALGVLASAIGSVPALDTARLILVALGTLIAGAAVSLRPGLPLGWLIGGVAAGLAVGGLPGHWDSGRFLATVVAVLGCVGAGLAAMPRTPRYSLLSLLVLFHFGGILTATTWPDPTPWLTNQVGYRIYRPYLWFLYLRNAYHFYSPEPGPASHLFVLLKYELDEIDPATGKPKIVREWITLPRRDEHMKDPMGQAYYRRLSITEMVAPTMPGMLTAESFEQHDVYTRRTVASYTSSGNAPTPIPILTNVDSPQLQYRVPLAHISRYMFPSYARHLAHQYSGPGRKVVEVKIYRVEHRIASPLAFHNGADVYAPIWYRPYFCGDFDANGKLLDPQDPMLYWLVPIAPVPDPSVPNSPDYTDYLSKHAGFAFDWGRIHP
ncbi:MAG: hypothetical protein LC104_19520 [Bacteroidales bacterium]|nr:hypothetical protein [Bacteroidales bacterium]